MVKIYHKEDFSDLPDYFWNHWLGKVKMEIMTTGFPLFLVRVGICDKTDEYQMYQNLWDIKQLKKDSTFYQDFEFQGKYIGIHLNTIFDYADMSIEQLIMLHSQLTD